MIRMGTQTRKCLKRGRISEQSFKFYKKMIGKDYNSLHVDGIAGYVTYDNASQRFVAMDCTCLECGDKTVVLAHNISQGRSKRCSKHNAERAGDAVRKHGMRKTTLYNRWVSLKARGVLCDEWNDFTDFYDGVKPDRSGERVLLRHNTDASFGPANFFWGDREALRHALGRRTARFNGSELSHAEIARLVGRSRERVRQVANSGRLREWVESLLSTGD